MSNSLKTNTDKVLETTKNKVTDSVSNNPLAAVAGGLALGTIAAALLPRTTREDQALGRIGTKARAVASTAFSAAKDAGKSELAVLGITTAAAKDQLQVVVKKLGQVATTASKAAGETVTRA